MTRSRVRAVSSLRALDAREPLLAKRSGHGVALCVLAAAALMAFYIFPYPVGGFGLGLGSDTPVYVWWARYAGVEGLNALGTGGRPAIVGPMAVLAEVTGTSVAAVAEAIGATLAASLALAAGALTELSLGRDRVRFAMAAMFTGMFLGPLAAGYFSTIAFGTLFLAALALLVAGVRPDRSSSLVVGGAVVLGAAGLSHPVFLGLAAAVLVGPFVALSSLWRRQAAEGVPLMRRGATRVATVGLGGLVVAAAGLPVLAGSTGISLDTSRDAALRRLGLGELVTESFRRKLVKDFPWYRAVAVVGPAVAPFLPRGWARRIARNGSGAVAAGDGDAGRHRRGLGERVFWAAVISWLAITLAGVVALLLGVPSPGQRLAAFCLPLPLLAAIGLRGLPGKVPPGRRRLGAAAMAVGIALFITVAWFEWADQYALVRPAAVAQAQVVGQALGRQPPETPLIVLIDPISEKPGLHLVRYLNYVRGGVPAARIPHVRAFVGTLQDFLAGRPTIRGNEEHDRLSIDSFRRTRPLLGRSPFVVVMRAFDPRNYLEVIELPEVRQRPEFFSIGPGVVAVPGFTGREHAPLEDAILPAPFSEPGTGPLSPWQPVWMAPLLLALVALAGAPWALLASALSVSTRVALAPAFGLAALGLASVAVDALGFRLSGSGAWVAQAVAMSSGVVVLAWVRLRGGRRAATRPRRQGPGPR